MPRGRESGFETGVMETESTVPFDVCTVNVEPVGSWIFRTFVQFGVKIKQFPGDSGMQLMVRMSTVTFGSMHTSQPISTSTMVKKSLESIGGGGLVHSSIGPVK